MSLISFSNISDGTNIDAADVNNPLNTIYDDYNGNLDNSNIAADAAIAGTKLADDSVPAGKIDFGGAGVGIWWEEIARTTLGVAADTVTVSSIPARNYLYIIFRGVATGGTLDAAVTFNNDTGNNYAQTFATGFGGPTAQVSQVSIPFESGATDSGQLTQGYMQVYGNVAAQEKSFSYESVSQDAAGAATNPANLRGFGKWANTSAQITRVDWVNAAGTGDFAIGSEVIVLGHN